MCSWDCSVDSAQVKEEEVIVNGRDGVSLGQRSRRLSCLQQVEQHQNIMNMEGNSTVLN